MFEQKVRALYPWLPEALVKVFASAWADTGDPELALAQTRQSPQYDQFFPGNRRDDGTFRMTEAEWFSTREAYADLIRGYGVNPDLFESKFTTWMEGNVSPTEAAGRLSGVFEQVVNNIPQVQAEFSRFFGSGAQGTAALFASVLDPAIGDDLMNHRIGVAQVAGELSARGFNVDFGFAENLANAGVGQQQAREFAAQADLQLSTLDDLAKRHLDPDDTFDLAELADASLFGDAEQTRRAQRLVRAEQSTFGTASTVASQGEALTGLTPR